MLEEILSSQNVYKALDRVEGHKGAGGIDNMQTDELRQYVSTHWQELKASIIAGSYRPSPVRKVEIPKPGGGKRMLGIPTVTDRFIQQAILQWLNPKCDGEFSEFSYGFRPKRNAHQAVLQAQTFLNEGKTWVVELDLEKFFDKVNHDKLMSLLEKKISDKRTLRLIRHYLQSGIMEGGVISPRNEGTPQGSPLSPLLSNILLNELDKELQQRGHNFVRYADDCSIYVRSEKAANRTVGSITDYIENRLKLKVNKEKTKVSRPMLSTLLGFSFYKSSDRWEIRISSKSIKRIKAKLKEKTKRNNPENTRVKIQKIETIIRGWVNYFVIAKAKSVMQQLDEMVKVRLRIGEWKSWKRIKTKIRKLISLGVNKHKAYMWANSSKRYCKIAHSPVLTTTLTDSYWKKSGYKGFYNTYFWKTEYQHKAF
jgi:RNA-directed DNA polymerase